MYSRPDRVKHESVSGINNQIAGRGNYSDCLLQAAELSKVVGRILTKNDLFEPDQLLKTIQKYI